MNQRHQPAAQRHVQSASSKRLCATCVIGICFACGLSAGAAAPLPADDARVVEARAIAIELGGRLKTQLTSALTSGGPVGALAVCNTVAPTLADDLSTRYAGKVGRTALKVRNTDNAPDAFERSVLEAFVARAADGEDISTLEHAEIVEQDGGRQFRYMKAIPMADAPCATCHGVSIDPGLLETIRERYPQDAATDFVPGEVRGAFTLRKTLP